MAKPTNSERIYSDKLPIVLKPVGCSYTDAEWKRYIRLFPANGWGIADEKDTRDNGKISDVVKQIAEKHQKLQSYRMEKRQKQKKRESNRPSYRQRNKRMEP